MQQKAQVNMFRTSFYIRDGVPYNAISSKRLELTAHAWLMVEMLDAAADEKGASKIGDYTRSQWHNSKVTYAMPLAALVI